MSNVREPIVIAGKTFDNPTVAEVGVLNGDHAEKMLEILNPRRLYLVDPWGAERSVYRKVRNRFADMEDIVSILRATSIEAADYYKDVRFDLVYIDADHRYDKVLVDLRKWYPLVKDGGMICGHDFNKREYNITGIKCGVGRAVFTFAYFSNLQVNISLNNQDWWIWKEIGN